MSDGSERMGEAPLKVSGGRSHLLFDVALRQGA